MTPGLFLSLWRQRWGKSAPTAGPGTPFPAVDRLANWFLWNIPGVPESMLVGYALCVPLLMPLQFGLQGQVLLVVPLLFVALWARGHDGLSASLVLCALAVFSTSRYLYWRFDAIWALADGRDFRIAMALWVVELGCVLGYCTQWLATQFPLRRVPSALPQDAQEWPRVGVFVLCAQANAEDIAHTLRSADALDWPRHMRTLYGIDTGGDEERVRALGVSQVPLTWIPPSAESHCTLDHLRNALWPTKDDVVLILRAGQTVHPQALRQSVGWFAQRPLLGLVATPGHGFLPPTLPTAPSQRHNGPVPQECLLLRRSFWLTHAAAAEAATPMHPAAAMLRAGIDMDWLLAASPTGEWGCTPIDPTSRTWRAVLHQAQRLFDPWRKTGVPVAATVPLWYFLAGIDPIPGDVPMLLALVLPHALFGAWLLHDRAVPSWWNAARDGLLGIHLLLLTALSTPVRRLRLHRWCTWERMVEGLWKPYHALLAVAHLAALVIAAQRFGDGDATTLYAVWSATVWVLLMAYWAVCGEMEEIRLHTLRRQRLSAMLRSAQQRSMVCETANFPQLPLRIATPIDVPWTAEEDIAVSIFCDNDECAVPAKVLAVSESRREVTVDVADRTEFARFVSAALARTPDWPEWFPDRDADNLLPAWVKRATQGRQGTPRRSTT
ncbi:cellulose synthase-like protein [Candidatus Symbiobacter mobilis]|uniref:Cellulose synthase-like protein n=1 Tax=Candidatus Symbiobacter mobilis CR TaxID=946483 RepID=U5N7Z1_9BURK|nr:cellulose synthase-like protein [Candidatus Symbiobacter mobilis]AGX87676.1 cellulose synthase-like protein [Candidatus Symbiobacter mobilis CR]